MATPGRWAPTPADAATIPKEGNLLILAHAESWERRFQISSLAASEAAAQRGVDIALFFAALDAWAKDEWDRLDPSPPLSVEHIERLGMPSLESMIAGGREEGRIRLYACSASVRLLSLDTRTVQDRVDAILGWQTFSRLIRGASSVVTL